MNLNTFMGRWIYNHESKPIGYVTDIRGDSDGIYVVCQLDSSLTRVTRTYRDPIPSIKKVIFNPPATIVFWSDDTKTVVKAGNEKFDPEKGLAMAIAKRALGNKGNYFEQIKKWTAQYDEQQAYPALVFDFGKAQKEAENTKLLGVVRQVEKDLYDVYVKKGATKANMTEAITNAVLDLRKVLNNG